MGRRSPCPVARAGRRTGRRASCPLVTWAPTTGAAQNVPTTRSTVPRSTRTSAGATEASEMQGDPRGPQPPEASAIRRHAAQTAHDVRRTGRRPSLASYPGLLLAPLLLSRAPRVRPSVPTRRPTNRRSSKAEGSAGASSSPGAETEPSLVHVISLNSRGRRRAPARFRGVDVCPPAQGGVDSPRLECTRTRSKEPT